MDIFKKNISLTSEQLFEVANCRYNDALLLFKAGQKHYNASMYLGGFVLECLFKGFLLEKYQLRDRAVTRPDYIIELIYKSHSLSAMLNELGELEKRLPNNNLWINLNIICGYWTVFARYSPKKANKREAEMFLHTVGDVKKCLKL